MVGVFSALIFQVFLKNPRNNYRKLTYGQNRTVNFDKIIRFCKSVQLYQVAVVFTTCKLLINVALIYIPLFINESAIDESGTIASIPLVAYMSSLVTSIGVEYIKPCCKSDKVSSMFKVLCSHGHLKRRARWSICLPLRDFNYNIYIILKFWTFIIV